MTRTSRKMINQRHDGYDCKEFDLVGAIIAKAILDYSNIHNSIDKLERYQLKVRSKFHTSFVHELISNYYSARNYLFNEDLLESFIHKCGLSETLSIVAIRNHAINLASKQKTISSLNCIKEYLT